MTARAHSSQDDVFAAARTLAVDVTAVEVVRGLAGAGVDAILLKGASLANWLYADGPRRDYTDVDILIDPEQVGAAERVLGDLGFQHTPLDDLAHDKPWHAHAWTNPRSPSIDLHRTLIGCGVDPQTVWQVLSRNTQVEDVAGARLKVLNVPARVVQVALHAAQDGVRLRRPLNDLRRIARVVTEEEWRAARDIAEALGALPAFGVGLRMHNDTIAIADSLGLGAAAPTDVVLRAAGAPVTALSVDWIMRMPGTLGKLRVVLGKALPPPEFLRAWTPLARWGRIGLVLAYPLRWMWLFMNTPRALVAWLRARRGLMRARPLDATPDDRVGEAGAGDRPQAGSGGR